jgi:hypothetical protein
MYNILHYIKKKKVITSIVYKHTEKLTQKECTVQSQKHTVNVYKNATFSLGLISWFTENV